MIIYIFCDILLKIYIGIHIQPDFAGTMSTASLSVSVYYLFVSIFASKCTFFVCTDQKSPHHNNFCIFSRLQKENMAEKGDVLEPGALKNHRRHHNQSN